MDDKKARESVSTPKTPTNVERIARDESFKTCKTVMPTPHTRRNLRVTPARTSILSGGKPYGGLDVSSGRKNRRPRRRTPGHPLIGLSQNETTDSNETFIKCEQELLIDRDSLEGNQQSSPFKANPQRIVARRPNINNISPDTLNLSPRKLTPMRTSSPKTSSRRLSSPKPKKVSPKIASAKRASPKKKASPQKKAPSPKFKSPKMIARKISPRKPVTRQFSLRQASTRKYSPQKLNNVRGLVTPLATTTLNASRLNSSRLYASRPRTQSFKSTAELERDYFSSLRSK